MNHLRCIESLLFIRGEKGISIRDISKVIDNNDYEYILYLISMIESRLENTVLKLKYNRIKKRYHVMIKPDYINLLQDLDIIKPRLSKAATATLSVIIFYYFKNKKIDIDFLKSLRTQNVKEHLIELDNAGYIKFDTEKETFEITQKLINEVDLYNLAKKIEKYF
ncbi:MAG: hypothetical protein GF329_21240 [Candidatus Lokiarchaeota archaeon]|nr:hypothetical protein [Candidatus Lokiarchaeota archaeon]